MASNSLITHFPGLPGISLALLDPFSMSVATRHQIDIAFGESSGAGMCDGFFGLKTL
jgi:hypothetical protein